MRLLKKWDKIQYDSSRERINPFRTFYLTSDEIEKINDLPKDSKGEIITSQDSEDLLKEILTSRGMQSLLYPALERDDWSGYVKLHDSGLFWML